MHPIRELPCPRRSTSQLEYALIGIAAKSNSLNVKCSLGSGKTSALVDRRGRTEIERQYLGMKRDSHGNSQFIALLICSPQGRLSLAHPGGSTAHSEKHSLLQIATPSPLAIDYTTLQRYYYVDKGVSDQHVVSTPHQKGISPADRAQNLLPLTSVLEKNQCNAVCFTCGDHGLALGLIQ